MGGGRFLSSVERQRFGGLTIAAVSYIGVDYLRHFSPKWHTRLQPTLWSILATVVVIRVPSYKHWRAEFRSALPFIASLLFMLAALLFEALCVRFVTAVLGLDWHSNTPPLPDTGQWILLALNENLPSIIVNTLRARIVGLHHFLMLFIMLAFSVLFDSIKAPGLGLAARYMFTMAIGRLLRAVSFVSTILPSARPWCASARYDIPLHPHRWAQKYYVPYSSNANAIRQVIYHDIAYVGLQGKLDEYRPEWGAMSFLIDFLRPTYSEGSSWYSLLKKAGGGCNDLLYSGHMLVAVLTGMAWTEAYGGFGSALIWLFVMHSAQREIRERHHYTVDCIVAIYVGILLWKMTGFIWAVKDKGEVELGKLKGRLVQAAKDSDIDRVREVLRDMGLDGEKRGCGGTSTGMKVFACVTIICSLAMVLLAFVLTSDG